MNVLTDKIIEMGKLARQAHAVQKALAVPA